MFLTQEEACSLKTGDVVVCPQIAEDQHAGWSEEMNAIVGKPLYVVQVLANINDPTSVIIREKPDLKGNQWTFDFNVLTTLERYEAAFNIKKKTAVVCYNNFEYRLRGNVALDTFSGALTEDLIALSSKILKNTKYVEFTKDTFLEIKKHCPRLIGFALSNNIIEKVPM